MGGRLAIVGIDPAMLLGKVTLREYQSGYAGVGHGVVAKLEAAAAQAHPAVPGCGGR